MHCWVNKGAKGIALIDEDSFSGLKYVFDISDVHKTRRIGRFPNLWEMREEHMEAVLSRLEKTYGDTDREAGFVGRIREIAGRIAEDCYKDLASDMEYLKEGSFLEELDELNVQKLMSFLICVFHAEPFWLDCHSLYFLLSHCSICSKSNHRISRVCVMWIFRWYFLAWNFQHCRKKTFRRRYCHVCLDGIGR